VPVAFPRIQETWEQNDANCTRNSFLGKMGGSTLGLRTQNIVLLLEFSRLRARLRLIVYRCTSEECLICVFSG